jgi:hypothetical protein
MLIASDDWIPSFVGCPSAFRSSLDKARAHANSSEECMRVRGATSLFCLGMNFFELSRWMCNDYIPLYSFGGDCFKVASDIFFGVEDLRRLAVFSANKAGHCYRAGNELARSGFCFFRAYDFAKVIGDTSHLTYFCRESWKTVTDRWLSPFAYSTAPGNAGPSFEDMLLRMDGYDFQWLTYFIFHQRGFQVQVNQLSKDGGIDLIGTLQSGSTSSSVYIQCKNPQVKTKRIPVATIREMLGACHIHSEKPDEIIIVTTTSFTTDAIDAATRCDIKTTLVDVSGIAAMIQEAYEMETFSDALPSTREEKRLLVGSGLLKARFVVAMYRHQRSRSTWPYFVDVDTDIPMIVEFLPGTRGAQCNAESIQYPIGKSAKRP